VHRVHTCNKSIPLFFLLVVYDHERALPSQHEVARGQDATDPVAEAATAKTEVSELQQYQGEDGGYIHISRPLIINARWPRYISIQSYGKRSKFHDQRVRCKCATSQAINKRGKRNGRGREDAIRSTHRTAPLLPPRRFCGQGTKTEKDGRMSHVSSPKSKS